MITKKIILTKEELKELIVNTYLDGFNYGQVIEKEQKERKVWTSRGRDVLTYAENKVKELLK